MLRPVLAGATCALLVSSLAAQAQFMLPYGSPLDVGTSNGMHTVNLGFNFTMPGGAVVTAVDVDTEGRIVMVGADPSDSSESVSELLGEGPAIATIWDTNTYTESTSDVFFGTNNSTVAWITWHDVNTAGVCTWQCQLYANGNIVMVFDSRCPQDDGILGVSPGGGAADPGGTDISSAIGAPIMTASPVVYEDYGFTTGVDTFDLQSTAVGFVPNGAGGANGWTVTATTGVIDPPVASFATVETVSQPCFEPASFRFAPDGTGGYNVTRIPLAYDANIGTALGLTSDDSPSGGGDGLDLGFAFPFPGGTSSQLVDLDPNGRIIPDGNITSGDFSPSISDLTTDGYPMLVPFWTDFNVNEPSSDDVYFNNVPGTSATITWKDMAQYDIDDASTPLTVQAKLFADGRFVVTLQDLAGYEGDRLTDDAMIGLSTGNSTGTEIDLSALTGTLMTGTNVVYEFFDTSSSAEEFDLLLGADLVALTAPALGTNWDLQIQDAPAGTAAGAYLVGLTPLSIGLEFIGIPCTAGVDPLAVLGTAPAGGGSFAPLSLPVPNNTALIGGVVFVQGITALPLLLTPTVAGQVGEY